MMTQTNWIDFNHRVTSDLTLVKEINGQQDVQHVKAGFNWLAALFTGIYPLVSQRYRTTGFVKKAWIPIFAIWVLDIIAQIVFGQLMSLVVNLAGLVIYGMMFDSWYRDQLLANGYRIKTE